MRIEIENRLFRLLVEVTRGSQAEIRGVFKCRAVSRSEHELRRILFRRTVHEIKMSGGEVNNE